MEEFTLTGQNGTENNSCYWPKSSLGEQGDKNQRKIMTKCNLVID